MGRGSGVRTLGDQAIQVAFTYRGKHQRKRLKLAPTKANLQFAKGLKARIDHALATNTFEWSAFFNEPDPYSVEAAGQSVADAIDAFIAGKKGEVTQHTLDEYECDGVIIKNKWGEYLLKDLPLLPFEQWLKDQDLSSKRRNNLLIPLRGAIKSLLRVPAEQGGLTRNPLAGLSVKKGGKKVQLDPFTHQEATLLATAPNTGPMWLVWIWTGLRSGEIAGLEWSDIDLKKGVVSIRRAIRKGFQKVPKTEAGVRSFELLPPALEALRKLADEPKKTGSDRVFFNPASRVGGEFSSDKQLRMAFHRACASVGVRYRYPYQCRHSFATFGMAAGEPVKWLAHVMGHRDGGALVAKTYARYAPELYPDAGKRMVAAAAATVSRASEGG